MLEKTLNFIRGRKTNGITGNRGLAISPPTGNAFMYIETGGKIFG